MIHVLVNRSVKMTVIIGMQYIGVVTTPIWVASKYNFTESVNEISFKNFLKIVNLGVNVLKLSNRNEESSTGESNKFSMFNLLLFLFFTGLL